MKFIKENWFIVFCIFVMFAVIAYVSILNFSPATLGKQHYSVEGNITDIYSRQVIIPSGKVMVPTTRYYLRITYISPKTGSIISFDEQVDSSIAGKYHVGDKVGLDAIE